MLSKGGLQSGRGGKVTALSDGCQRGYGQTLLKANLLALMVFIGEAMLHKGHSMIALNEVWKGPLVVAQLFRHRRAGSVIPLDYLGCLPLSRAR